MCAFGLGQWGRARLVYQSTGQGDGLSTSLPGIHLLVSLFLPFLVPTPERALEVADVRSGKWGCTRNARTPVLLPQGQACPE